MQTKKTAFLRFFYVQSLLIKKDGFHLALPCHALCCAAPHRIASHRATSIPVPQAQLLMPEATINDAEGA